MTATPQGETAPHDVAPPLEATHRVERCAHLRQHLHDTLLLLKQYEDHLVLADDPKTKARDAAEIEELRRRLAGYELEYRNLACE